MDPESPSSLKPSTSVDDSKRPVGAQRQTSLSLQKVRAASLAAASTRGRYSVVKVEEKHGMFHQAIPVMPLPVAVLLCILNVFLPGTGTLFSAPLSLCLPTRHPKVCRAFGVNLLAALLQMLTFVIIVGWIWSILWGMNMVTLALKEKEDHLPVEELSKIHQDQLHKNLFDPKMSFTVRRHSGY